MKILTERVSIRLILLGMLMFIPAFIFFLWQDYTFDTSQGVNSDKFGQFGDFIGGVIGSIWALASVILFYVTLKDQREERIFTKENFEEQSKILRLQQFESTFFNSLNLFISISDYSKLTFSAKKWGSKEFPGIEYEGRAKFEFIYQRLAFNYHSISLGEKEKAIASYIETFSIYQSSLSHYFRTLYNIIKFIDDRCPRDTKYYINLVRAQLSTYEHLLLFYNCLSEQGKDFKPLIIKYSLLDNMAIDLLLDDSHKSFYPDKAYE